MHNYEKVWYGSIAVNICLTMYIIRTTNRRNCEEDFRYTAMHRLIERSFHCACTLNGEPPITYQKPHCVLYNDFELLRIIEGAYCYARLLENNAKIIEKLSGPKITGPRIATPFLNNDYKREGRDRTLLYAKSLMYTAEFQEEMLIEKAKIHSIFNFALCPLINRFGDEKFHINIEKTFECVKTLKCNTTIK
jgi:hypothetical protein